MMVNKSLLLYVQGIHGQRIIHFLQIIQDIYYFLGRHLSDQYLSSYLWRLLQGGEYLVGHFYLNY